ncbi:hypothetical protein LEP1GSC018_1406 [Leptospira kirschneri str. 2008720114]|uniref:hypothetical protein n=1 Tax=Leptospira kirschneri TaxID=29507 RepID=UPI000297A048|nr:hypothetical protein [Leptospira kirschneri]EKP05275.1 hypothetical protein LEP1GSC018_1406 [Leptospira kirschneri str. 2008720114]
MKVGITKKTESTAFAERSKSKFRDVGSTDHADSGLTVWSFALGCRLGHNSQAF